MGRMQLEEEQQWTLDSLPRKTLPGWLLSLLLHATLLCIFVFSAPRQGSLEGDAGTYREIGLELKSDSATNDAEKPAEIAREEVVQPLIDPLSDVTPISPQPPVPLKLPDLPTLGAGATAPITPPALASLQQVPASTGEVGTPAPATGNAGGPTRKGQGTTFLGLSAEGRTFLYLIDKSASMVHHNSIGVARAELLASLEKLESTQRYQIVFYDTDVHPVSDRTQKHQIFFATDVNRTWTRRSINSFEPGGGTDHKPCLLFALSYKPDVIFFLSDGDTPALQTADQEDIVRANRGRTQIHVIEFGEGSKITPGNWLEKLARLNNGTYRYRDVAAGQ